MHRKRQTNDGWITKGRERGKEGGKKAGRKGRRKEGRIADLSNCLGYAFPEM